MKRLGDESTSSRRRHFTLCCLLVVLSLVLVGAKGCKKPKGFGSATARTGDTYWYYIGVNHWDGNMFGGALWCQSSEPRAGEEPHLFCGSNRPASLHKGSATIVCGNPGYTVTATCGYQ